MEYQKRMRVFVFKPQQNQQQQRNIFFNVKTAHIRGKNKKYFED